MILFHYTCDHGAEGIRRSGVLRPNPQALLPRPLVWLTDLAEPHRDALGLTSLILSCDRTAHRFRVDTTAAMWWPHYARTVPPWAREALDGEPGAMPAHWWVVDVPVPIDPDHPAPPT